jgi:single-strand DNA-binding protein
MITGTQITIIGNCGDNPELRYTQSGTAAASFSVAVPQRKRNPATGKWEDSGTTWYRVNAWRDLAENIAGTLSKGMRVIVMGMLASRPWEDGDKRGIAWEITADAAGPDLTFATARVIKSSRVPLPADPWEPGTAGTRSADSILADNEPPAAGR